MDITKEHLKQIIEEELLEMMNENEESMKENDITKADLKKVIREELEAFLDENNANKQLDEIGAISAAVEWWKRMGDFYSNPKKYMGHRGKKTAKVTGPAAIAVKAGKKAVDKVGSKARTGLVGIKNRPKKKSASQQTKRQAWSKRDAYIRDQEKRRSM